jgi:hypothetical protein
MMTRFMNHFGWISAAEGLSHAMAFPAWPVHYDQPLDAKLVCKYLGAGFPCAALGCHDITRTATIRGTIDLAGGQQFFDGGGQHVMVNIIFTDFLTVSNDDVSPI